MSVEKAAIGREGLSALVIDSALLPRIITLISGATPWFGMDVTDALGGLRMVWCPI